jgi:uncharacterized protein YndB with AHSA1/START domain
MDGNAIEAKAEMLVRRPVAEVFEAFINPEITAKFWFSKGSDRLEVGRTVRWEWEMYNFSTTAAAKEIEENRRIVIEWSGYPQPTEIEWIFTPRPDQTTYVSVFNRGFVGEDAQIIRNALDSTEGFAFVLAGLKAYLEHGVRLNLVDDKFPDMRVDS